MAVSHRSTLIQVAAALAVGGAVVGGIAWYGTKGDDPKPCKAASRNPADVTGAQLCSALKKAGLPALLGIPKAAAEYGGAMTQPVEGGEASVHVLYTVGPYSVIVSTHKPGSVKAKEQVAGHAAALVAGTSSGHQLYNLVVSYDAAGTGFYSVDVMMTNGAAMTEDDAGRLERTVATKVLPTLPEWKS